MREKAIMKDVVGCLLAACDALDKEVERLINAGLTRKEAMAWLRAHPPKYRVSPTHRVTRME